MVGYISTAEKEITKTGLILYDKAREIQKKNRICKKIKSIWTANYTFSVSMFSNIETNEGVNAGADTGIKISFVPDKDIIIITNPNFLFKKDKVYALQTLVFESPFISVKVKVKKKEVLML